jgi:hypothetical protein
MSYLTWMGKFFTVSNPVVGSNILLFNMYRGSFQWGKGAEV